MNHTLQIDTPLHRCYQLDFGPEEIAELIARRLIEMQPNVTAPGFRPGKVPVAEMQRRFGGQAMQDVLLKNARQFCETLLQEQSLTPACPPIITPLFDLPTPGVSARLDIMVAPVLEDPDFAPFAGKLYRHKLDDASVEEAVERNIRRAAFSMIEYQAVSEQSRPQPHDRVGLSIDTVHDEDREKAPFAGSGNLTLGLQSLPFEVEAVALQMQPGETREETVFFDPETTLTPQLSGRSLALRFELKAIERPVSDEPSLELLKSKGFDSFETVRQQVREHTIDWLERQMTERLHEDVGKILLSIYPLTIPDIFLSELVEEFLNGVAANARQSVDPETLATLREHAREPLHKRNLIGILINAQVKRLGIVVEPSEVEVRLRTVRADMPLGAARKEAASQVVYEKVMAALVEEIGAVEKIVSQGEFIRAVVDNPVVTKLAVA